MRMENGQGLYGQPRLSGTRRGVTDIRMLRHTRLSTAVCAVASIHPLPSLPLLTLPRPHLGRNNARIRPYVAPRRTAPGPLSPSWHPFWSPHAPIRQVSNFAARSLLRTRNIRRSAYPHGVPQFHRSSIAHRSQYCDLRISRAFFRGTRCASGCVKTAGKSLGSWPRTVRGPIIAWLTALTCNSSCCGAN